MIHCSFPLRFALFPTIICKHTQLYEQSSNIDEHHHHHKIKTNRISHAIDMKIPKRKKSSKKKKMVQNDDLKSLEGDGEEEYYYYYYYDEKETGDDNLVETPTNEGGSNEENEYYYYYYYYYNTSDTGKGNNSTKGNNQVQDSTHPTASPIEEEEYYYYYYEPNESKSPTASPTDEGVEYYYYYYYNTTDDKSPTVSPTDEGVEYYYYYYNTTDDKSPTASPTDEGVEYYYYYYYDTTESNPPSMAPTSKSESADIAIGRGCQNYLLSPSMRNVFTFDVSFTFMIETSSNFGKNDIIAERIIERAAPSMLACKSEKQPLTKREKGVFLVHYAESEPIIDVVNCSPIVDKQNKCSILKGTLFLASNKVISDQDKQKSLSSLEMAINNLSTENDVLFTKYLGPSIHDRQKNNLSDEIAVAFTILTSIAILLYLGNKYRQTSWNRYQRIAFVNT